MENKEFPSDIAIHCPTQESFNKVIKRLEEMKIKNLFTENVWLRKKAKTCISVGLQNDTNCKFIEYTYIGYYEDNNYTIIKAKEFLKEYNMEERNLKLSLESATELYKTATDEMKTILENTFPELVKSKYPMSHDELQEMIKDKDTCFITTESVVNKAKVWFDASRYHTNRNIILSEKRAKEHLALIQLTALRDKWNEIDEFEPDWSDGNIAKYCISNQEGVTYIDEWWTTSSPLYFRTEETCALFFKTFKDLIEEAKNLI